MKIYNTNYTGFQFLQYQRSKTKNIFVGFLEKESAASWKEILVVFYENVS